jgi:3-deoxy-D-manno-octulosonic-acid transferase
MILDSGTGFSVRGADDLGARIVELLSGKSRLAQIADAANRLIAANRGAAERCVLAIADLYGDRPETKGQVDLGTYATRAT